MDQHRRTLLGSSLTFDKANSALVGVLSSDHSWSGRLIEAIPLEVKKN